MTMVPVTIMCMHVDCCLVLHKNASCYLTCIVSMTMDGACDNNVHAC